MVPPLSLRDTAAHERIGAGMTGQSVLSVSENF